MLHVDVSGHTSNINRNWNYFTDHLTEDKKVANFAWVTEVTLKHDEEYFPFLAVETSTAA